MKELYEVKEKLCDELKSFGKKDMTPGSLDVIDKLAHSIKNIDKVIDNYEAKEGYSGRYEHDRWRNTNRDSQGRYSTRGDSYGGYSYNDMNDYR